MNTEDDDLEQWLAPLPPGANEPSPQELFVRTHASLRGRVRLQWIGRALAALVCLGIGYGLGFSTAPTSTVIVAIAVPPIPVPVAPETVPQPKAEPPEPSAAQLEMRAELSDDPAEVAALFRQAGDKYLEIERDYPRATRCYRLHLLALNQPNPALQPDDTWLLASLKPLSRKESKP